MEELFYVQDKTRGYVGNCIVWWKHNDRGYVCDIKQAKVFTKEEAVKICKPAGDLWMWPKKYIDERIQHHIDMQYCNPENAIKDFGK